MGSKNPQPFLLLITSHLTFHIPPSKMQLAVQQEDADILLKTRNVLDSLVLDKYRQAGRIVLAGLKYAIDLVNERYHFSHTPILAQEMCLLCDSFLASELAKVYTHKVREKGIAFPTSVDVNELALGFSPEMDDAAPYTFNAGDAVTVSMGVHIDGYTANVAHTLVIYPPGEGPNAVPAGPLLGSKADAICAAHLATETVIGLLGLALLPEKIPAGLGQGPIGGSHIRHAVDAIAASFNCVVAPGSKVRRVRRFLAGQAEGIVAERDFKGVVWDELHQEQALLALGQTKDLVKHVPSKRSDTANAMPTDEFIVEAGEVYQVDMRFCGMAENDTLGVVTLEEVDNYLGKNHQTEMNAKASVFVRDYMVSHALKLLGARKLLKQVDAKFGVFPFKLQHAVASFPVSIDDMERPLDTQMDEVRKQVRQHRLGLSELNNRHMVRARPIQMTKFVPLREILLASNATGRHGMDMDKPVLPGMEVPLPQMGVSLLKLRSLCKLGTAIASVRQVATIMLCVDLPEIVCVSSKGPSYVHSTMQLQGGLQGTVEQISKMMDDKRYGLKITRL